MKVNFAEPSIADRFQAATEQVEAHVLKMKEAEDRFADSREMSALQREHSRLLGIWSGLKATLEREAK